MRLFLCPAATINPIDANGCTETCRCVRRGDVCPNEPACGSDCPAGNVHPSEGSGCITGCTCVPAPSADGGAGGLKLYYTCGDPLCRGYTGGSGPPLCTTEKVGDACSVDGQKCDPSKERLGFMIDDNEGSAAVNAQRDLVDLYGYTSMAVATIQLQAQQINALEREVAEMRKTLARRPPPPRK